MKTKARRKIRNGIAWEAVKAARNAACAGRVNRICRSAERYLPVVEDRIARQAGGSSLARFRLDGEPETHPELLMNSMPLRLAACWLLSIASICFAQTFPTADEVMAQVESVYSTARAPREPGMPVKRVHLSGVMRAVNRTMAQFSPAQLDRLRQLSPSLSAVVKAATTAREGLAPESSLPPLPQLTQVETGRTCLVHYTTGAGQDQVTDAYAQLVAAEIDRATRTLARFGRARFEGPPGDKMNVYVHALPNAFGVTSGISFVSGPESQTTFMEIDVNLDPTVLRLTCHHEYMHAIQLACNGHSHDWFCEGQAVWVESALLRDHRALINFMHAPDSVCNRPDLPLYNNQYDRNYTTAAFMLYLTHKRGAGIMKRWLTATKTTDDSLSALQSVLGDDGRVFSGLYRQYLAGLYRKKLPGVPDSVFLDVPLEGDLDELGQDLTATLPPTGAKFWRIRPDDRIPNEYIIGKVAEGSGAPEMILEKRPDRFSPLKVITPPDADDVPGFKSSGEMLAILTDTKALNETGPNTTITAQLLSPYLVFKKIEPQTPIAAGERSQMPITYDLLGLPPSIPIFRMDFRLAEKGPGVRDYASSEINVRTGVDKQIFPFFQSASDRSGTYRHLWTGLTPPKSYTKKKIPQSKTSIRTEVVVNPPAAAPFRTGRESEVTEAAGIAVDE